MPGIRDGRFLAQRIYGLGACLAEQLPGFKVRLTEPLHGLKAHLSGKSSIRRVEVSEPLVASGICEHDNEGYRKAVRGQVPLKCDSAAVRARGSEVST